MALRRSNVEGCNILILQGKELREREIVPIAKQITRALKESLGR